MISKTAQSRNSKNIRGLTANNSRGVSDILRTAQQIARAREALRLSLNRPYEPLSEALTLAKDQALNELNLEAQRLADREALKKQRQLEIRARAELEAQQPEQLIELDQALSESGTSPC